MAANNNEIERHAWKQTDKHATMMQEIIILEHVSSIMFNGDAHKSTRKLVIAQQITNTMT